MFYELMKRKCLHHQHYEVFHGGSGSLGLGEIGKSKIFSTVAVAGGDGETGLLFSGEQ